MRKLREYRKNKKRLLSVEWIEYAAVQNIADYVATLFQLIYILYSAHKIVKSLCWSAAQPPLTILLLTNILRTSTKSLCELTD